MRIVSIFIFGEKLLADLGVTVDSHKKLPGLVIYCREKNSLFLMEAASAHGLVNTKRYGELSELFGNLLACLVYVFCFPKRENAEISTDLVWETDVRVASDPAYTIHFDREKFWVYIAHNFGSIFKFDQSISFSQLNVSA